MKHQLKHALVCMALTAGLQFTSTTANAVLLATEPFDYTIDSPIQGLNGGFGWIEAWPAPSGSITITNTLNYSGVYTPGGAVRVPINANFNNGGRDWSASLPDGTYWYSFIVGLENQGRGTIIPFKRSDDNQNGFGLRIDNGTEPSFKSWTPQQASGGNITFGGTYDGSTYFVFGKLEFNRGAAGVSTNTIWVYKNPTALPATEGALSGGSVATADAAQAATVTPALGGRNFSSGGVYMFDHVRIGTTFADVFPPAGPAPSFGISPAAAVENQQLTATWSDIPGTASAIVLNPGNVDLLPLTSGGAGQTTLQAPGVSTEYVLTYTVDGTPTSLTNQFTAIAPFLTISPASAWENDTLNFNWRVPVGSSPVTIEPGPFGGSYDATGETSFTDGSGTTSWLAPSSNTTYVLSYTYNAATLSVTQQFTLANPFFSVTSPAIENGALAISWRVDDPLGVTGVALEYGPAGGPLTSVDVTANTDFFLGSGNYNNQLTASLVNTNFNLRWTNSNGAFVLSTNITVNPEIFVNLVAINNTKPVIINPAPMADGVTAYSDRGHVWAAVPDILIGAQFVKFGQDDKFPTNLMVSFTAAKDATFFLLLDNRIGDNIGGNNPAAGTDHPPTLPNALNTMAWVLDSGFVDSGVDIGLDENPVPGTVSIDQSYSVYFRQVSANETFTFYEQADNTTGGPGGRNMYGVAAVAPQVTPISFVAFPEVINQGEASTLSWTVQPGSTVSIDNGIGDVSAVTDPVFGTGSTNIAPPVGTNSYTLTYDPPGVAPPVNLGPVTIIVNAPAIPTDPTNLTFSVANGQIILSWPEEYLGWSLQKQTNLLSVGLGTNWQTVEGSQTVTTNSFPLGEAEATFFRMLLLQP